MNKGFTLIELLAVIIILALIGLVSMIGITTVISRSKSDLYQTQMKSIESAAKQWGNENIDKLPSDGKCIYLTLDNLKTYGLLDSKLVDPRTNEQIDDALKIKISSRYLTEYSRSVIEYEVDAEDVTGCTNIYGDYTLVEGVEFNRRIKTLGTTVDNSIETSIRTIVFLKPGQIPNDIPQATFEAFEHVDLSVNNDLSVIGYYTNGTVYVYSDGILHANAVSNNMFYGLQALEAIDFSGLSTEYVVSMTSMFELCSNLKILDLSNFDTSNTYVMDNMFNGCSNLQKLDISSFDVSKVNSSTGVYTNMFKNCNPTVGISVNASMRDFIQARLVESNIEINITVK